MAIRRARLGLLAAAAVVCAACAAALLWPRLAQTPAEPPAPSAALQSAAQGLDSVTIDAVFDPVARTLAVTQTCALQNRTGGAQRLLVLRSYAGAFRSADYAPCATEELFDSCYPEGFTEGGVTLAEVTAAQTGGAAQAVAYAYGDEAQTVLRLSLAEDWATGGTLTLTLRYTLRIPVAAYRYGEHGGIFLLGNAFILPAPFMDGQYRTDEYYPVGDPFVSECRNFTVRVSVPEGYAVAGSAAPVYAAGAQGLRTATMTLPAARDFTLCISQSYRLAQTTAGGALVLAYARTDAGARALLDAGAAALACYGDAYGAYPYPALTLCEADFPLDSLEYPGLAVLSSAKVDAGGDALEQEVARSVAHQWWAALVGTDAFNDPWQDEALCEFSLLTYWRASHGQAARDALAFDRLETAMRVTIPRGVTPGSPLDYFGDWSEYRVVVLGRGGAAMLALDQAMGGGLNGFLRAYAETYAFQLATRAGFEALLARYTGEDWAPLLSDYLDTYLNN